MNQNSHDFENVKKIFEELDSEVDAFIKYVKEIKRIKYNAETFPDKLKQNELEIEKQKRELDGLTSSTNNLLINFEERAKGLFFDLEQKTDDLVSEIKSTIPQFKNIFQFSVAELKDKAMEKIAQVSKEYALTQAPYEDIKNRVDSHEQSINTLKKDLEDNYIETRKMLENFGLSLKEIKKNQFSLQERTSTTKGKIEKMEELLTKNEKQKNFTLVKSSIFFRMYHSCHFISHAIKKFLKH